MEKEAERISSFRQKYPNLFKEIKYLSINEGWNQLLHSLSSLIEEEINNLPMEIKGEMYLVQVKEKFGGLRVYMNQSTPFMDGVICLAESMSYSICEDCGMPGQRSTSNGWIKVRCDSCIEAAAQLHKKESAKKGK